MVDVVVSATHKVKAQPANSVQQQANVKSFWYCKIIVINNGTQVVKTQPCNKSDNNIAYNEPTDM